MSEQALRGAAVRSYFPNLGLAVRWAALAVVGFLALWVHYDETQGALVAPIGLFALQSCLTNLFGVRVKADRVTLPRPLWKRIPLLVLGRTSIALANLGDVTAVGQTLGFEVVVLTTPDGVVPTVFGSREPRLAFFEAIKRRLPGIRIYRAY